MKGWLPEVKQTSLVAGDKSVCRAPVRWEFRLQAA